MIIKQVYLLAFLFFLPQHSFAGKSCGVYVVINNNQVISSSLGIDKKITVGIGVELKFYAYTDGAFSFCCPEESSLDNMVWSSYLNGVSTIEDTGSMFISTTVEGFVHQDLICSGFEVTRVDLSQQSLYELLNDENAILGITGKQENIKLNLYPNPVSDALTIERGNNNQEIYAIYSISGSLLESGSIASYKTVVDFSSYPTGTYLFVMERPDGYIRRKILKIIR